MTATERQMFPESFTRVTQACERRQNQLQGAKDVEFQRELISLGHRTAGKTVKKWYSQSDAEDRMWWSSWAWRTGQWAAESEVCRTHESSTEGD